MSLVRSAARGACLLLTVAVPSLAPGTRLAAQAPATGVVVGRVTVRADTSVSPAPAFGVSIVLVGTPLLAATGADGRFVLDAVPAGAQTLRVRLIGYRTVDRGIRVVAGDTLRVDILLESQVQRLAPVRTSARFPDLEKFETRPNVATITIDAAAMAGVPSVGEPDVVRVVRLLPGVVSRNDFNTGLNVRGGEADQNLVLLDGHQIYNPFHLGGLFSTFMDATVGGIELMTGAFPARYGGRLSSVLDVRSAEEARGGIHGSADVSALATTGRLAGGFDDAKGTWSVAARRTYVDAVTSAFTDDVFPYHFHDIQAHAGWTLPGDVRVTLTGYTGRDDLSVDLAELEGDSVPQSASEGNYAFDWGNQVVGLGIARDFGPYARVPLLGWALEPGSRVEQRLTYSDFSMLLDLGEGAFSQRSRTRDFRASGSLLARMGVHDASVGYEVATHRVRFAAGSAQLGTSDFDLVQRPTSGALWVDDMWRLSSRWIVQAGLRAEALTGRDWAALSPRASLKFFATPTLAFTAAAGRMTQTMHSISGDGPLRLFDVWIASDEYVPVASAWHWVAGAERRVGETGSVRMEGYLKHYDRVLEPNPSQDPRRRGDEFLVADGRSYGVDVLARWQPASGTGGWISYTYGVSTRSRDGRTWAPGYDRRHDVNVVALRQLAKYRVGVRFGFASGTPYTPIVGEIARRVYDPSQERWGTGDPRVYLESIGGARNAARFPPTQRLDLDVSREFRARGATISPYVSVANAYNAQNVFVYLYDYSTAFPTRRAISQFPILPSAGVRVVF